MIHSKDELLDYLIRYMAENELEMNTFEQMKFACFADWLQKQNFCKPDVSGRSEQLPLDAFEIIDNGMENEMKLRQMIDQWCEGQLGNTDEAREKADTMFTAARDIFYGFGGGNCH